MEESTAQPQQVSRTRRILRIAGEAMLILTILGLIAAFLLPVMKGPSDESFRRPEFGGPRGGARDGRRGPAFQR